MPKPEIAAYYFPNYHPDRRNEAFTGRKGWSEWELVEAARPRFEGHPLPYRPLWGKCDESDPQVMAMKIDAAADHGVDTFLFDWYYYNDGPYLERALDEGFLGAPNNDRLQFALMWANHDWHDIHPADPDVTPQTRYSGLLNPDVFEAVSTRMLEQYFSHPSYLKVDGAPFFSIYDAPHFVRSFGSVKAAREALDRWRRKAVAFGFPGLHINLVDWDVAILFGEGGAKRPAALAPELGADSINAYIWVHYTDMTRHEKNDYDAVAAQYFESFARLRAEAAVPVYPNVTMGWDPSARTRQDKPWKVGDYPFHGTLSGNTPARFEAALERALALAAEGEGFQMLTINAWNEWTEGSFLEPEVSLGFGYLEAIKRASAKVCVSGS
ncbi:glycoside hydrolase family 99-like domain-containing protein [Ruficoccus amylovorans]|uniref:Glycoside hydrolase family 99-like domain-containing protein n=1 Tax=Ruficoccus amylovorans TaxID=1804625 RepID=A0A842HEV4_9BACT|nr:glycoside hydrolase family 99-like domain-containing protein [Ruficoccus amylovorans]MBC2594176.1 glycoside hydrolase family 99-like domain-containing protein [Ruficoccus amylovorans]